LGEPFRDGEHRYGEHCFAVRVQLFGQAVPGRRASLFQIRDPFQD
jgi:hypothetical protein